MDCKAIDNMFEAVKLVIASCFQSTLKNLIMRIYQFLLMNFDNFTDLPVSKNTYISDLLHDYIYYNPLNIMSIYICNSTYSYVHIHHEKQQEGHHPTKPSTILWFLHNMS